MAARGRAAAAMAAAAAERRLPSLDEFAGQSWSAWVERAGPPAEPGSGSELEESGKSSSKKLDAMTLIKEDMNIFGHCPAHDEFYLVVCNHCSQVVKPQAFQKHCERRHGPLSKLYARATAAAKCHVAINGQPAAGGTPSAAKVLREKPPGARGRVQPLPERPDKDNNLCLFVPVVNLEKIPSIPKPDGHGIKVPPKAVPTNSKEPLGKPATAAVPKEPPVSAGVGGDSAMPADGPGCKPESAPAPGEKDAGASKPPPRSHKKLARKECDLNRQCGVLNPDTKKICTRLLTCKIHSVHQRREVQGRAKDFDVLVAELKASSRKGESPKERSPPGKEPLPPSQQDPSSLPQPPAGPPSTSPCRAKPPHSHCPLPRAQLSSDSDPEDTPAASAEGGTGVFTFPLPKAGSRVSSEESEEEGGEEPPRPPTRPPRPQAVSEGTPGWVGDHPALPSAHPPVSRCWPRAAWDAWGGRGGGIGGVHADCVMCVCVCVSRPSSAPLGAAWSARAVTSSTGGLTASARRWAPCWSGTSAPTCGGRSLRPPSHLSTRPRPPPALPPLPAAQPPPPPHPPHGPRQHRRPPPAPGRAGSPPASTTRWGRPTRRPPAASRSAGGAAASPSPPRCRPTSPRPPSASCLPPRPANLPEPGKRSAGRMRIPANGSPLWPPVAPPINGPVWGMGSKAKMPAARFRRPPARRNPPRRAARPLPPPPSSTAQRG
uniref:Ataxin 7 like 2 n=1 Tax=Accipiter nisus TaxID=211598 RepID=A0A8B9NQN5_9AVES